MLAPKTIKNQHFSRIPAPDRNCPPKTIAYHNIQLMSYTALLRPPSTPRYLENDEKWRQQNDWKEHARARAWNDKLYGATSDTCIYEKKYHRGMNGFFPYVIYFFSTHHASNTINTSKIHEKHMSRCADVKYSRIDEQSTQTSGIKNTHT